MKNIKYLIGSILIFISLLNCIAELISYLFIDRTIVTVYSFNYVIIYIGIPAFILSTAVLLFSNKENKGSKFNLLFRYLYYINILFYIAVTVFFYFESFKIKITVKNLSNQNFKEVKIFARDKLIFQSKSLPIKDSIVFITNSRKPNDTIETIGMAMEITRKNGKTNYILVSSNEPVYKDEIRILLSDTSSLINNDIKGEWVRLKEYNTPSSAKSDY